MLKYVLSGTVVKQTTFCLQLARKTLYIGFQNRKNIMYGLL